MKPTIHTFLLRAPCLLILLIALLGSGLLAPAAPSSAAQTQQKIYVPLIAGGASGPGSEALIDAALERGEIDDETALIYYVFAVFQDPRLPAKYHGDDSQPSDREITGQLAARFNQLSPQAKAILEPFIIPPYHTGSWWDLRQNGTLATTASIGPAELRCGQTGDVDEPKFNQWHYYDSPGGMVRVWWQARYPEDEAKARNYASVVDDIWLKLAALMRRQPLSDQGDTKFCRGGDNRLDISLVDLYHNGLTIPYTFDPVATPSYILLKRISGISTLIHELMHAFQFAYDVAGSYAEYSWWREATAVWAEHYVDTALNSEHRFAQSMLGAPELPLDYYSLAEQQHGYAHQYGAYLFPLFQQLKTGQPDLVRSSWEQFEHFTNSLGAINSLLPGGFTKQWPEFTLRNVNQSPVDDYWKADKLPNQAKPKLNQKVELQGAPSVTYALDGAVQHLAAHHFHFGFTDASVRSVAFENPFWDGTFPTAHVRAVYRVGASEWASEDWTDKHFATFCRDLKAERVSELYIVISNSEWNDRSHVLKPASAPRLHATNVACRGWEVEAELTHTNTSPNVDQTSVVKTKATYELYREGHQRYHFERYKLADGIANWTHSGHLGGCAGTASGSYPVADPSLPYTMVVETYNVGYQPPYSEGSRKYTASGARASHEPTTVIYTCPDSQTHEEYIDAAISGWLETDRDLDEWRSVNPDGRTLEGSLTYTEESESRTGTMEYRYTWKMTALPPE